jgi:hypothetical protein
MIIKPNWNIFRAKFKDSETTNFEYFCYLLFCVEFNQPYGIFRYKNQAGIESNPIEIDGKVIGFQSKFYDVKLRDKKNDMLKMLSTIHKKYPTLTELKFYTNQNWGQGKKENDSQVKKGIESKAKDFGINIDWRTDEAYFQSPNVSINNKAIASHFFSMESAYDLVVQKQNHTTRVLSNINTEIKFNIDTLEIDRTDTINTLNKELINHQIIVLSGVGGVGKTAIIKKLYEQAIDDIPFYLFKANEFHLNNINELFGEYSLENFIDIHDKYNEKIVIIDSAEKLLDINNDVFKEFLSSLIQNKWKIIFTTRNSYLNELNYQFIEILKIQPVHISIDILTYDELVKLSDEYKFNLPTDIKLEQLIKNPFYLNEYLSSYNQNEEFDYQDFKQKIWQKNIKNPKSEQCFLDLAYKRAKLSEFYIQTECNSNVLEELIEDDILGYEKDLGHFISHDIYEEWALEKIINKEYINRSDIQTFFNDIGSSLPIRRAFRSWVSEKLLLNDENIKSFIEDIIDSSDIEIFWKDEIFISILLSDYSDTFFKIFDRELKANNFILLNKLSFLLRLSCKEVDSGLFDLYKLNGTQKLDIFQLFNMPKGNGWKSFIAFVSDNIETLKLQNINIILPILYDWNSKYKEGKTTKLASLLALKYYQLINQEEHKYNYDEAIEKICNIIISGIIEIQQELEVIFDKIIENNFKDRKDDYYKLSIKILSTYNGLPKAFPILQKMPKYVLKLANLFWTKTPVKETNNQWLSYNREEVEDAYGIDNIYELKYFPSSAYQTPIYHMLKIDFSNTIDFLLNFINKSVEHYAKSTWEQEKIRTVRLYIDHDTVVEQYHSQALWNIYRGTSSPNSPNLLQSIHMALEKYFLEIAKVLESNVLEYWLIYLLKNTKSSSISAVISSVVLANQDKMFNMAIILFKTKEFIQADLIRSINDKSESRYLQDERLKTCDDKHRDSSLENIFLAYQLFRTKEIAEKESEDRLKILFGILDNYYNKLPSQNIQTDEDMQWRMYLARMDKRKMDIETEKVEGGVQITFKPKLASELAEYSEKSQEENSNTLKYISLTLWSSYKVKTNDDCKKYKEFEENPLLALQKIKEILEISYEQRDFILQDEIFTNVSISLLKYYKENLSKEDIELCKDLILEFSKKQFSKNYRYQISDGTDLAISNLPILLDEFQDLDNDIKTILLFSLFNNYEVGMSGVNIHDYAINAIVDYYNETEINNFMFWYLFLKPKYDLLYQKLRRENYQIEKSEVMNNFFDIYEKDIERFTTDEISIETIDFNIDLSNLGTILKFIKSPKVQPSDLFKELSKVFILKVFQPKKKEEKPLKNMITNEKLDEMFLIRREEYEDINLELKQKLFEFLPYLIYKLEIPDIALYLQPLLDNFSNREDTSFLLLEFIKVQDALKEYDKFWHIWDLFEDKVKQICKNGEYNYTSKIIQTYLLSWGPYGAIWNDKAKEWHSLRENDKRFFKRISNEIGHCPSTLYSISKLLTDIGSLYLNDGIGWISSMLDKNKNLYIDKLESNTIFYLENLTKKYIFENTEKLKKEKKLKEDVLIILNFLVEKGSSTGYMLRERIL